MVVSMPYAAPVEARGSAWARCDRDRRTRRRSSCPLAGPRHRCLPQTMSDLFRAVAEKVLRGVIVDTTFEYAHITREWFSESPAPPSGTRHSAIATPPKESSMAKTVTAAELFHKIEAGSVPEILDVRNKDEVPGQQGRGPPRPSRRATSPSTRSSRTSRTTPAGRCPARSSSAARQRFRARGRGVRGPRRRDAVARRRHRGLGEAPCLPLRFRTCPAGCGRGSSSVQPRRASPT